MTFRERTQSVTDEHVDERAYEFFSFGYRGEGGRSSYWNSTSEKLSPTATLSGKSYGLPVCAYCGRQALPIQSRKFSSGYYTEGYCCVCKDAMDELEIRDKIKEVTERMEQVIEKLKESAPRINKDVLRSLVEEKNKIDIEMLDRAHCPTDYLAEELGFDLKTTKESVVMSLSKQRGED